jgi:hypothetical protein
MARRQFRIVSATAVLLFVAAVGFLSVVAVKYWLLQMRVTFAEDQVAIFENMKRDSNSSTDPHQIAGFLAYTVSYYPSGTKQVTGSPLDRMVEASRADAIAAIIDRFRFVTGKELGPKPEPWLTEYPPSDTPATRPA